MRATVKPSRPLFGVRLLAHPFALLVIYVGYLAAILIVHFAYYCQLRPDDCWMIEQAATDGMDWFGAAILDNYAFVAILLYPLMIAYLQLTERLDTDFRDMVVTLAGRGVLQTAPAGAGRPMALRPGRPEAVRELDRIEAWAAKRAGMLAAATTLFVLFLVGTVVARWFDAASSSLPVWYSATLTGFHLLLAVPCVFLAVSRLGRVFCYGLAVLRHRRYGVEPRPIVEHSDRAGGLKPLGDYFLAQAYRMGLISGYLVLTTLFLLLSSELEPLMLGINHKEVHQSLFRGISVLTVFVLLIQLLCLLLPFATVHARMVECKRALIGRAAVMTRRRQRLLALLEAKQRTGEDVAAERAQLDLVERWIESYDAFPTWPIPNHSLRNFWILWGGAIGTALSMLISAITSGGASG